MILYLDCFSGISGDMLLGALVDAGLDADTLREGLASLDLSGWSLDARRVTDHGISGTRVTVAVAGEGDRGTEVPAQSAGAKARSTLAQHEHRTYRDVVALIERSRLSESVREQTLAAFGRLAEAEAQIHGTMPDEVTFHEVGAVDSIVDITGAYIAFEALGVTQLYCSPLPLTSGRVKSAHGVLPVPAPAVLALLAGTGVEWVPVEAARGAGAEARGELVTPTGALFAAEAAFAQPSMTVARVGYGFGTRALPWANCLRVLLGEAPGVAVAGFERDEVTVIEANIDDMTGEALGWLLRRLLEAGALDVSYAPIQMKKDRPAVRLTIIAAMEQADALAALALRESTTLGVRMSRMPRLKAHREVETIETPLGPCAVKVKREGERVLAVSPEYDDCAALAAHASLPLDVVLARVTAAARRHFGLEP
ncbi:MAG TPA: nickel pincer cofactor biosynthesis protein LarC [Ktedonobacterales bacterium]